MNNLVYWYHYETILASRNLIQKFGDNVAYWKGNTCQTCSTKGYRNELNRFSTCRDKTSARYKGVSGKGGECI